MPDDVAERLERLAAREGMSVNAYAVRELAEGSRRVDNATLLRTLPDHRNISREDIVADIRAMRGE